MDMKTIGRRARNLRLDKEWTQKELARRAKVTANTIRGFERGSLQTRWPKIHDIARALGTTFEQLQQGEPVKPTDPLLADLTHEDLLVARTYHHSTTDVRQRVLALLQNSQTDTDKTSGEPPSDDAISERIAHLNHRYRRFIDRVLAMAEHDQETAERPGTPKPTQSKTKRAKKA
jgi:transcriptional regulator with XRE-family HTH domain